MTHSDIRKVNKKIQSIESEFNIFNHKINGIHYYERIRGEIYKTIYILLGVKRSSLSNNNRQKHSTRKNSSAEMKNKLTEYNSAISGSFHSLFVNNPYLAEDSKYMLFGTSKKFINSNGNWIDKVLDPIIQHLDSYLLLEKSNHKKPLEADNVAYVDLPIQVGHIPVELNFPITQFKSDDKMKLSSFQKKINDEFDVNINIKKRARDCLTRHKVRLPLFDRLIKSVNPQLVVVRYGLDQLKSTLIQACRNNNVTVVDMQFRSLDKNEPHYHYPKEFERQLKADYYLTWGKFWEEAVELPYENEQVRTVGFPYIDEKVNEYEEIKSENKILFLSGGNKRKLSKFASDVSNNINNEWEVIYKPHPGSEYENWEDWFPWLKKSEVTVIEDIKTSLYELFAKSKVQVGIATTALFEGLAFDLDTYLVEGDRSNQVEALNKNGYAEYVDSPSNLINNVEYKSKNNQMNKHSKEYFFASNAHSNIKNFLSEM